jgi:phage terminase small subunit
MLTHKQEHFAQLIAKGESQIEAYRQSFTVRESTKRSSVDVSASKLMSDPKIRQRVEELRKPAVEAVQMTLEGHLRDLLALRNMAVKNGNVSAAINAEVARGKASGVGASEKHLTGDVNITLKLGNLKIDPDELGW